MANMDVGPVKVGATYAYSEGNENTTDEENANLFASDWEPLLILLSHTGHENLGNVGNLNDQERGGLTVNDQNTEQAGYKLWMASAEFSPMENITLNAVIGRATADEPERIAAGADDDYGVEYDVGCTIKLMDNLTYKIVWGYLDAGDLWKQGNANLNADDSYSVFHSLDVVF
jgi:hypothetical protein